MYLVQVANFVDLDEGDEATKAAKLRFVLRRSAGLAPSVFAEYLFGTLLSSEAHADLAALNPYLTKQAADDMLGAVAVAVLRASRLGHLNRAIGAAIKLNKILQKTLKMPVEARISEKSTLLPTMVQQVGGLSTWIGASRFFVEQEQKADGGVKYSYDPRFLLFEFTWNIVLRAKQVEIVNTFMDNLKQGKSLVKQMM